jgi:hypothetical protein
MKFIIMQFSPRSVFLPFRSKYPQHCSQKRSVISIFIFSNWMWEFTCIWVSESVRKNSGMYQYHEVRPINDLLRSHDFIRLSEVKLFLCLTKHHIIYTYWGMEVYIHAFLISALDGGEWSASRPGRFTPGVRAPSTISYRPIISIYIKYQ